jgi:IS5 family transposase
MEKSFDKHQHLFMPSVEDLVRKDHPYRNIFELVDFEVLIRIFHLKPSNYGRPDYNMLSTFKALILQSMEDLSNRELERFVQENNATKLFADLV